jgi:hypothetical protein
MTRITRRCTNKHSPCSFLLGFYSRQVETFGELRSELEVLAEAYEVGRRTGVRHGSASEFAVLVCAAMVEAYPVPAMRLHCYAAEVFSSPRQEILSPCPPSSLRRHHPLCLSTTRLAHRTAQAKEAEAARSGLELKLAREREAALARVMGFDCWAGGHLNRRMMACFVLFAGGGQSVLTVAVNGNGSVIFPPNF